MARRAFEKKRELSHKAGYYTVRTKEQDLVDRVCRSGGLAAPDFARGREGCRDGLEDSGYDGVVDGLDMPAALHTAGCAVPKDVGFEVGNMVMSPERRVLKQNAEGTQVPYDNDFGAHAMADYDAHAMAWSLDDYDNYAMAWALADFDAHAMAWKRAPFPRLRGGKLWYADEKW
ncbi:hypothetical protein LTR56_023364 [Elasticomyces elasticus]|nr:hypothetical protein LTR56_023364 [Elasticomyces elasticus]KAK3652574.1 hypothetical protein LTR22_011524 [Elasticomyces elasticus]KAK4914931.1 hypothetical protein LTR49_016920 [Elasticomyces elasticus]KAK5740618.1 hypothetical protein LTS12_024877 [Elasticomyces elasticus]